MAVTYIPEKSCTYSDIETLASNLDETVSVVGNNNNVLVNNNFYRVSIFLHNKEYSTIFKDNKFSL